MIKINLLGDSTVKAASGRGLVVVYGGSLVIVLLGIVLLQQLASFQVKEEGQEVELLQAQLSSLQVKTKEVQGLDSKRAELEAKLAVITKLKFGKKGPVRLMDDINLALPNRLWLTDLRETGGKLQITGLALEYEQMTEFLRALQSSEYIQEVELKESGQTYIVREEDVSEKKGLKISGRSSDQEEAQRSFGKIYKVRTYESLSVEQRAGFDNDKPGFGIKAISFTLECKVTYFGKARQKLIEAKEAAEKAAREKKEAKSQQPAVPAKKEE